MEQIGEFATQRQVGIPTSMRSTFSRFDDFIFPALKEIGPFDISITSQNKITLTPTTATDLTAKFETSGIIEFKITTGIASRFVNFAWKTGSTSSERTKPIFESIAVTVDSQYTSDNAEDFDISQLKEMMDDGVYKTIDCYDINDEMKLRMVPETTFVDIEKILIFLQL